MIWMQWGVLKQFGNEQSHFHSDDHLIKTSQMEVSQMENVKVHHGKKHSLENSKVVCLLNTNAL